jgi:SSS family solute:Na+ symporter
MVVSLLLTLIIPLAVSWAGPVKRISALHVESTTPDEVREYVAKPEDVRKRAQEIAVWDAAHAAGKAEGEQPVAWTEGEKVKMTFPGRKVAVFWSGGIKVNDKGEKVGDGLFKPEMYLLALLGMNPENYSPSTNESISVLFKLVFPFATLIITGLLIRPRPEDRAILDRFYGRLLTPVKEDPEEDAREVEKTYQDPQRFEKTKLFPGSDWNLRRWTWFDWQGLVYAGSAMAVIGTLVILFAKAIY